jgi:hypothetical protein
MRAGRRHRRALERHRVQTLMAEADESPAELVAVTEDKYEIWQKGRVAFVLPGTPPNAPDAVRSGIAARKAAALRGRCDCGATRDTHRPGRVAFVHEYECPASDQAIVAAWDAWKAGT